MKKVTNNHTLIAIGAILGFVILVSVIPLGVQAIVNCNQDSDCGKNYWENQYCQEDSVYGTYVKRICLKPSGTTVGSCVTPEKEKKKLMTCVLGCEAIGNTAECIGGLVSSGSSGDSSQSYISHSYKQCSGNSVYWFDSNNIKQDVYQTCSTNQFCSGNTCLNSYVQPTQPTYTSHILKGCVGNTSYWYDSLGKQQDIYQNCNLTGQTCTNGQCIGQIIQPKTQATQCKPVDNLAISIFGQKEDGTFQWVKDFNASVSDKVNFLVVVKNMSESTLENVTIKVDVSDFIAYENRLVIDNVATEKDIASGINLGTMSANSSKIVSFSGSVHPKELERDTIKITSSTNAGSISDDDSLTINIEKPYEKPSVVTDTPADSPANRPTDTTTAAVSENPLIGFFKSWYIWIILAVVLVFLFIIIFRRLSARSVA